MLMKWRSHISVFIICVIWRRRFFLLLYGELYHKKIDANINYLDMFRIGISRSKQNKNLKTLAKLNKYVTRQTRTKRRRHHETGKKKKRKKKKKKKNKNKNKAKHNKPRTMKLLCGVRSLVWYKIWNAKCKWISHTIKRFWKLLSLENHLETCYSLIYPVCQ